MEYVRAQATAQAAGESKRLRKRRGGRKTRRFFSGTALSKPRRHWPPAWIDPPLVGPSLPVFSRLPD